MARDSFEFACNPFDEMRIGAVDLGAPLHDGVIQIGTTTKTGDVRLLVAKEDPQLITVARIDGAPIQAELVAYDGGSITRMPVFENPVDGLEFRRERTRRIWSAHSSEGLEPTNPEFLEIFASMVGKFAVYKQYMNILQADRQRARV